MELDALAFGAHPDDVELTCAGTLIKLQSKGYSTGVVSLTRGELATRGDTRTRLKEANAAARIMGVTTHGVLELPDGNLGSTPEQKMTVVQEIRRLRPEIVFAPFWQDRHPDHANASDLVREASFLAGLSKIDTGQEPHRPNRVIFYACRYEFQPSFIVDVSEFHNRKMEAVRAYKSQFAGGGRGPETNISRPEFLEAIEVRGRQYGAYIGVEYGEPFLVKEPLKLEDPVEFFGPEYLDSFL